jgi:hypothetical protein
MTELREALRPKADEDPLVLFQDRVTEVLERHHEETGERVNAWAVLPDESPGDALARTRKLNEALRIRRAESGRRRDGGREKWSSISALIGIVPTNPRRAAPVSSTRTIDRGAPRLKRHKRPNFGTG